MCVAIASCNFGSGLSLSSCMVDGVIIIIFTMVPFLSLSFFFSSSSSATVRQGINDCYIESSWRLKWTPLHSIYIQHRRFILFAVVCVVFFYFSSSYSTRPQVVVVASLSLYSATVLFCFLKLVKSCRA